MTPAPGRRFALGEDQRGPLFFVEKTGKIRIFRWTNPYIYVNIYLQGTQNTKQQKGGTK